MPNNLVALTMMVALAISTDRGAAIKPADGSRGADRTAKELDDDLLRGIGGRPEKAVDGQQPSAERQVPQTPGGAPRVKPVDPFAHGEDVGVAPAGQVFQAIEKQMLVVQQRLREMDTSEPTQEMQRRIVMDLDAVIQQMQEQMAAQRTGSQQTDASNQQGKPSDKDGGDTGDRRASGTPDPSSANDGQLAETDAMRKALDRFWGNLPERVRRQVQNMNAVEFLPEYQKLIEDYYQRLAEEQGR
jgi:hypothetical protein